ncbi:hypothetical protein GE061_015916 [Apolygus lucorum]|uniref:Kinase n=1 Tax=Apolygus lucorum TaxID=248454 RepID=A0A8S9XEI9_APOLU|nr:hypothetical protein GE061_015916 [Apolygus lucorum]
MDKQFSKLLPDGFAAFENQVAGHNLKDGRSPTGILKSADGFVLKPVTKHPQSETEIGFYESIFIHEKYACFRPFVPEFKGTTVLNILGLDITFLKLQDITKGYIKPCVMDVKIGSQTWDPNATESKRKTEDEKYQLSKKEFGFCIPGYQVYNLSSGSFNKMGKDQGRLLDKSTLPQALREFFNVNFSQSPFLIERFLQRLVAILDMWNSQKEVHIYSSSLLFAYDAHQLELFKTETSDLPCWMNIMMIDFAHVVPACNKHNRALLEFKDLTYLMVTCESRLSGMQQT